MPKATEKSWRLQARAGRVVLTNGPGREVDPASLPLPDTLVSALREWADVAHRVQDSNGSVTEIVSQRGRQLAARLTQETGAEIAYVDPVSDALNRIGHPSGHAVGRHRSGGPQVIAPQPPTPWATGLTVSAITAAIVVVTLVVVTLGVADVSVLLAAGINLAVAAGLTPSIVLGRKVPVWRWVAFGTAAGIVLSWIALILSTLG